MSRRARAVAFAVAAALCAGLAAAVTGGAGIDAETRFGALRDVVVTSRPLPAGRRLDREAIARSLELRRVPERFLPAGALSDPAQALGRAPAAAIPPGAYLLAFELATPGAGRERAPRIGAGRRPVEIAVQGAAPLAGSDAPGRRVDVVVTTEPGPTAAGRTYVAARGVGLLDLRPAGAGSGGDVLAGPESEAWIATLALTRSQALRLIHAQSFARDVRLIGR